MNHQLLIFFQLLKVLVLLQLEFIVINNNNNNYYAKIKLRIIHSININKIKI